MKIKYTYCHQIIFHLWNKSYLFYRNYLNLLISTRHRHLRTKSSVCSGLISIPFSRYAKAIWNNKKRTDLNQIQWTWISYNIYYIYKRNLVLILVWLTIGSPFFISCSACLAKINKFIRISDSPCFFPVDLCFKSFPLRSSAPRIRIFF